MRVAVAKATASSLYGMGVLDGFVLATGGSAVVSSLLFHRIFKCEGASSLIRPVYVREARAW
jgi:hypothetical protein